jgi:hypothetical protein
VTPEEARARARAILAKQHQTQVIRLNPDGSLAPGSDKRPTPKKTILHDSKGEYAPQRVPGR